MFMYSNAADMIPWLGANENTAECLQSVAEMDDPDHELLTFYDFDYLSCA
jgi:hypothetical protein